MNYVEIDCGPWPDKSDGLCVKVLKKIIPAANPDLEEEFYPQTRKWWIELDERRVAHREIGFNEDGIPIVIGPVGRNYGFAVDDSSQWSESFPDCEEATKLFNQYWDQVYPRFSHLEYKSQQVTGGDAAR